MHQPNSVAFAVLRFLEIASSAKNAEQALGKGRRTPTSPPSWTPCTSIRQDGLRCTLLPLIIVILPSACSFLHDAMVKEEIHDARCLKTIGGARLGSEQGEPGLVEGFFLAFQGALRSGDAFSLCLSRFRLISICVRRSIRSDFLLEESTRLD